MGRRGVIAAAVVLAVAIAAAAAVFLRPRDGDPPARTEVVNATVTGVAAPGWRMGMRVVVDDDGRAWELVADKLEIRIGDQVTVTGDVLAPDAKAPDVVRLGAVTAAGVTPAPTDVLRVVGRTGIVAINGPARLSGALRVDGEPVAGMRLIAGRVRWNTRSVRPGAHLVSVVVGKRPAAFGWVIVANAPREESVPGRLAWDGGFEKGNLSQWDLRQSVSPDRARVVSAPAHEGRYAARFEVRQGEDPIDSSGPRAELTRLSNEQEGDERWYTWSVLFAPGFPTGEGWQVVTQWHSDADGPPPVGLYAQNGRLELQVNRHVVPGEPLDTQVLWSGPLKPGQWRDLRLRAVWSGNDEAGLLQLFVDGVEVVPETRIRTLYPGYGAYLKLGYYRDPAITEPGVVYHDGMRVNVIRGGEPEPR